MDSRDSLDRYNFCKDLLWKVPFEKRELIKVNLYKEKGLEIHYNENDIYENCYNPIILKKENFKNISCIPIMFDHSPLSYKDVDDFSREGYLLYGYKNIDEKKYMSDPKSLQSLRLMKKSLTFIKNILFEYFNDRCIDKLSEERCSSKVHPGCCGFTAPIFACILNQYLLHYTKYEPLEQDKTILIDMATSYYREISGYEKSSTGVGRKCKGFTDNNFTENGVYLVALYDRAEYGMDDCNTFHHFIVYIHDEFCILIDTWACDKGSRKEWVRIMKTIDFQRVIKFINTTDDLNVLNTCLNIFFCIPHGNDGNEYPNDEIYYHSTFYEIDIKFMAGSIFLGHNTNGYWYKHAGNNRLPTKEWKDFTISHAPGSENAPAIESNYQSIVQLINHNKEVVINITFNESDLGYFEVGNKKIKLVNEEFTGTYEYDECISMRIDDKKNKTLSIEHCPNLPNSDIFMNLFDFLAYILELDRIKVYDRATMPTDNCDKWNLGLEGLIQNGYSYYNQFGFFPYKNNKPYMIDVEVIQNTQLKVFDKVFDKIEEFENIDELYLFLNEYLNVTENDTIHTFINNYFDKCMDTRFKHVDKKSIFNDLQIIFNIICDYIDEKVLDQGPYDHSGQSEFPLFKEINEIPDYNFTLNKSTKKHVDYDLHIYTKHAIENTNILENPYQRRKPILTRKTKKINKFGWKTEWKGKMSKNGGKTKRKMKTKTKTKEKKTYKGSINI